MNEINGNSAPALLRHLAKEIEEGKDPSYFLCAIRGEDDLRSGFNVGQEPFALIGLVGVCNLRLLAAFEG